jgi:hypothetical protein
MNMLILVYLSQAINQMSMVAVISQFWAIPFLVWLRFVDTATVSKWTTWLVMTIFLASPYGEPLQTPFHSRAGTDCSSPPYPSRLGLSQL